MTHLAAPPAFRWRREVWGDALASVPLERRAQHLFTTRQLQLHTSDVEHAWQLAAESVDAKPQHLFRIKQVHGRAVRVVCAGDVTAQGIAARPEADAIVSNVPGVALAVQVADCVPMLVADRRQSVAAAIHAGWRGTAAGIAVETIATLQREFGSRPDDLIVACGPSIGTCCYEVGRELVDAFRAAGASDEQIGRWFSEPVAGKLRLDLWQATHDQLVAAGVPAAQIQMSRLCTQTHADVFHSYRAAGPRAGRIIGIVRVPA